MGAAKLYSRVMFPMTIWFCFAVSISGGVPRDRRVRVLQQDEQKTSEQSSEAGWTFCFEHKCRCQGDRADCSGNLGALAFIPRLPERVTFLNFSANSVGKMSDNFFTNVTNITSVDMSDNGMVLISSNAFKSLRNMTQLFIGNNPELSYAKLNPVFSLSTLVELDVASGNLGALPTGFFHKYPLPNLKVLNLHNNHLLLDDLTEFSALDSLSDLDLSYNDIAVMKTEAVLDLHRINLEHNAVSEFPQTCRNKASLFPQLTHLILRQNKLASLVKEMCLPSLRHLDLGQNSVSVLRTNGFTLEPFPSLTELHLDSMASGMREIESHAFNNPSLEVLSLSNNSLDFGFIMCVKPDSFQGCPRLTTLLIDRNYFGVDKDTRDKYFRTVANLSHLDLGNMDMWTLTSDTFSYLPKLCQLFLSGNGLSDIPDGAFDSLLNLTTLDLSNNDISVIRETTFNATTRGRLQHLDLSGNPFECSCELQWFMTWRRKDPAVFSSSSNYTCSDVDDGIDMRNSFFLSDQACLLSFIASIVLLCGIWYMYIFLFVALYFLRKRLRVQRSIRRALGGNNNNNNNQQLLAEENLEYDLFVAYAEGDEDWVRGQLAPEVEGRMGLRMCLHQRDFHPGRHILDNIESSVCASRKVMMVFSAHFARSQWCQFELTLCQRHVMDRDDCLVVVYLHDVPERDLTPGMMAILRTSTYLLWSEEPGDAAYFWGGLRHALHAVIRRHAQRGGRGRL